MKMTPWEHSMTMYASFRHHLFTVIRMQERNSVPRLWDPNGIKLWQTINEINLTITPVTFGWLCRSSIFFPIEKLTFSCTWTSRGTTCDRTKLIYQSSWLSPCAYWYQPWGNDSFGKRYIYIFLWLLQVNSTTNDEAVQSYKSAIYVRSRSPESGYTQKDFRNARSVSKL